MIGVRALHYKIQSLFLREQENWILWLPIFFAAGILFYFSLADEPAFLFDVSIALIALLSTIIARKYPPLFLVCLAFLFASMGFLTIHVRATYLAAPILKEETGITKVKGRVVDIFPLSSGKRIILDKLDIRALPSFATPVNIRLIVRTNSDGVQIGDVISVRAALSPPPPPVLPYGYDFARTAYFKQIGATGYTVSAVKILNSPETTSFWQHLYNFRQQMAEHILTVMGQRTGTIATALMLGMDSAIPKEIVTEMRSSGVSHILSVSGMHLSLVAAIFFFLARMLILLCCRPLALRFDIKKIAALTAIAGSLGYYLVSGMQVAAFRSFLMTALVLMAIILNRTATPMRSIAWAALIILILQPESIMTPSFQMSFAAVIALVATYNSSSKLIEILLNYGLPGHIITYVGGVAFSSLIASAATTPFALYHFNQYANYAILANLLAVPLTSFLVMPLAVLAFFLYPFGLDAPILLLMQWGIEWFIAIAHFTASLPHAVKLSPFVPPISFIFIVLGGLWLCLWQAFRLRIIGVIPIVAGIIIMVTAPKPDIIIDGKGKLFAVRDNNGELMVSSRQHSRYAREMWLKQNGQMETLNFMKEIPDDGGTLMECDDEGCIYSVKGQVVFFALAAHALENSCRFASILINFTKISPSCCFPYMVTLENLRQNGTHMLFLDQNKPIRHITVGETRGHRLWSGALGNI